MVLLLTDESASDEGATEESFLFFATCWASGSSSLSVASSLSWRTPKLRFWPVWLVKIEVEAEVDEFVEGAGPKGGSETCFGRGREMPPPHAPGLGCMGLNVPTTGLGAAASEAISGDEAAVGAVDLTGGAGFFSTDGVFEGLTASEY